MATVEELVIQALARAMEFGDNFPATRSLLYRRLGVRQQQLFAAAARVNPYYFGDIAIGTLDAAGSIDINLSGDPEAADPVENMELISEVAIEDPGTSGFAAGDEVHVVPLHDPEVAFAPRVTIQGHVIRQVGTDLANVVSIRLYYSRRPFRIDPDDAASPISLPETFSELLVVDVAKYLLRKAATIPQEVRQVALTALEAEEQEALGNFIEHVREFTAGAEKGRWGRTQGATKQ